MKNLRIKIKISDREYFLNTAPETEALLRKAGKILNEQLKSKKQQFGSNDKQDLFAIIAFDTIVDSLQKHSNEKALYNQISALNDIVASSLEETNS